MLDAAGGEDGEAPPFERGPVELIYAGSSDQ